MKYTPGPWRITKAGYDDNLMFKVQVGNSERTVAYAYSPTGDSTPEQTANAQLIAAAPELLEALEAVVRVADRKTDEFDQARAAIAKARGEK